jgi:hypothetical protein
LSPDRFASAKIPSCNGVVEALQLAHRSNWLGPQPTLEEAQRTAALLEDVIHHKLVCAGQLDLKTAQREIASNWIEAYHKYVAKSPPAPIVRETKTAPANSTANEVWVNTHSGKYRKPGSRFHGKIKEGEFMSELDAFERGYSPAGGTGQ